MKQIQSLFRVPRLTGPRMALALLVAVVIDGLQFLVGLFGPAGWIIDGALDFVGMVLTNWILGFHILLLPTFVVKMVPLLEELPTWTACVVAVIALRKREQEAEISRLNPRVPPQIIEVECPPHLAETVKRIPPSPNLDRPTPK